MTRPSLAANITLPARLAALGLDADTRYRVDYTAERSSPTWGLITALHGPERTPTAITLSTMGGVDLVITWHAITSFATPQPPHPGAT